MGGSSRKIDVDKLISYSDDLVELLKDNRDIDNLTRCLSQLESLKSSCDADFNETLDAIRGRCSFSLCFSARFRVFYFIHYIYIYSYKYSKFVHVKAQVLV